MEKCHSFTEKREPDALILFMSALHNKKSSNFLDGCVEFGR